MNEEIMIDCGEVILREYRMEDVPELYELLYSRKYISLFRVHRLRLNSV
ncbi:hypothetical protein M3598_21390 [Cytobacillus oceanisediminis]|nr:hypothetical protein [Cytobacillus oceanisediminis]MCM3245301.1 hypothetical protein [Cytobacillus oceanisediminis]